MKLKEFFKRFDKCPHYHKNAQFCSYLHHSITNGYAVICHCEKCPNLPKS